MSGGKQKRRNGFSKRRAVLLLDRHAPIETERRRLMKACNLLKSITFTMKHRHSVHDPLLDLDHGDFADGCEIILRMVEQSVDNLDIVALKHAVTQ